MTLAIQQPNASSAKTPVNFAIRPDGPLAGEEVFDLLDENVAAYVGDGFGEGELFGAGLDAVLREATLLDAAVSG